MPEIFDDFMKRRAEAASAYVAGDPSLVEALSAASGQATFFDPSGGFTEGAANINDANRRGAQSFGPGGKSHFEIKDQGSSTDLAYWTGFQVADIEMKESGEKMPMRLRVTEIFRLLDGKWRMIHRHASIAKER